MREKTLIELIEDVVKFRQEYDDTQDESNILMLNDRAAILAERMDCSNMAAVCFAFILNEASWGRMPTRNDIMKFLPPRTQIVERLECIWELLDRKLIQIYKPARNPIRHFYIDQEIAEKIVANRIPVIKSVSLFHDEEDRKVRISATNDSDFEIMLDGKVAGYILTSAHGNIYEVYWHGVLVYQGEELSGIVEWLNDAYENGVIK